VSTIPHAVVRARQMTGWLLLVVSIVTTAALALAFGAYLSAPRTVQPVAAPSGGNAPIGAAAQPPGGGTSATAPLTPSQQLASLRASDAPTVFAVPDGYWVVQLASNRVGTDRAGRRWDEASILTDHQARRNRYGGALLWSGDFATYSRPDHWVTVVPSQVASSPEPLLAWCAQQGVDRDHCAAKRLSTTSAYTGDNSRYRK
jgi:hypothetical protein